MADYSVKIPEINKILYIKDEINPDKYKFSLRLNEKELKLFLVENENLIS